MSKSVALILAVLVFLAGAAVARAFMASPKPPAEAPPARPAPAPRAQAPTEPAADLAAELALLRAELAELKKSLEPLKETDRQLRPLLAAAQGEPAPGPVRAATPVNADGAAGVADLLALDPGRTTALRRAHEETMRKIRAAEERHASVKKDGKITAITVSPFPDEGKALVAEWSQQLDALLTPAEKEKYRKYSMEQSLFPMGLDKLGVQERTITITGGGNSYSVSETASSGRGGSWTRSSSGPESILAPYRHLLNAEGGR